MRGRDTGDKCVVLIFIVFRGINNKDDKIFMVRLIRSVVLEVAVNYVIL